MEKPRFQSSFETGSEVVHNTIVERGAQYGDTLEETRWLTLESTLRRTMGVHPDQRTCRMIALAVLQDVKYWRQLGPFKVDTQIDMVAFATALLGEIERQAIEAKG